LLAKYDDLSRQRLFRRFAQVFDQQIQVIGVAGAGIKIEVLVEAPRVVDLGMDDNGTDAYPYKIVLPAPAIRHLS
jgi:hypothetical protein